MNKRTFERNACAGALSALLALGTWVDHASAQTFNSESTGADGALDLTGTPSGTTVYFKQDSPNDDPAFPSIEDRLGRPLNWDDTRFDFTTITIPAGVTLRMSAQWTNGPIYWLATGAVNIAGTVNLSAVTSGHGFVRPAERLPSIPGPGGFRGGLGGNANTASGTAQSGLGPGGGLAAPNPIHSWLGLGGKATPSIFLVPLVGGSGGGGGRSNQFETSGGGGGAGGGALLIASSVSITLAGRIDASGSYGPGQCNNFAGGGGAGGSIRLVAPLLNGGGTIVVGPGGSGCSNGEVYGEYGRVRLEAYQHAWSYNLSQTNYTTGSPLKAFVPTTPPPSVRVISVAGAPVATKPNGGFSPPDVTINNSGAVPVVIEARNLPSSATPTITLTLFSLEAPDQTFTTAGATPTITAIAGQPGRYQASATLPSGFTRGYVRATW